MKKEHSLFYHTINSDTARPACYSFSFYRNDEEIFSKSDILAEHGDNYDINKKFVESAIYALSIIDQNEIDSLNIYTRSSYVKSFLMENKEFIKDSCDVDINVFSLRSNRNSTKKRSNLNKVLQEVIKSCQGFRSKYKFKDGSYKLIDKNKGNAIPKKSKLKTSITTDASFDPNYSVGAWAAQISTGSDSYSFFGLCPDSVKSSSEAEVYAIMSGLSKCEEIGLDGSVVVFTDAQGEIKKNKGVSIQRLAKSNGVDINFDVQWIGRNSTKAHALCDKTARKTMRNCRDNTARKRKRMTSGIKNYKCR